jgi:hypothetical protein
VNPVTGFSLMKSHDLLVWSGDLAVYFLHVLMPPSASAIRGELCRFMQWIQRVLVFRVQEQHIDELQDDIVDILARLELLAPLWFHNVTKHQVMHIPLLIRRFGCAPLLWMFSFEVCFLCLSVCLSVCITHVPFFG